MSRLDELALKLVDAGLTSTEQSEFERLMSADPEAARQACALLDVEADLRGGRVPANLAPGVLKLIESQREARVSSAVLKQIRLREGSRRFKNARMPEVSARRTHWSHWLNGAVAAAAIVAVATWVVLKPATKPENPGVAQRPDGGTTKPTDQIEPPPQTPISAKDVVPPPAPDAFGTVIFSDDFENGLPGNWQCGKIQTTDLPPGAKGAVRQVVKPKADHFGIFSCQDRKIFDPVPGDVIHLTFRTDSPEPVKVVLKMRKNDGDFREGQIDHVIQSSGQGWQTVHLPLSDFFMARAIIEKATVTCYGYSLGTVKPDIGLTLARFWITRPKSAP